MVRTDADVAVVGLGALGAHAAWRLAVHGLRVLGFEQFRPGHPLGSSHGGTRLFRVACFEHPDLTTVARRSRALWDELAAVTGLPPVLRTTGGLVIGPPGSEAIRGTRAAALAHGLPLGELTAAELRRDHPQHAGLGPDVVGLVDPEAGVVDPEGAVLAATAAARTLGAVLHPYARVHGIVTGGDTVEIRTDAGVHSARQVVVATGPWLRRLVPDVPLRVSRTPMTWFAPRDPAGPSFALADFPVFVRALDGTGERGLWGHGATGGDGVKLGPFTDPSYRTVDPDTIDRGPRGGDHDLVSELVAEALPGLDPVPSRTVMCMVSHTPDDQFVVGRPRGTGRVVVAGGGSGHAFKHAAGLGDLVAQLVVGERPYVDTGFVAPDRFVAGRTTGLVT